MILRRTPVYQNIGIRASEGRLRVKTKIWVLALAVASFTASGCAILENRRELSTLSDYSREQDALHCYVNNQDKRFKKLIEVVKNNRIKEYPTSKSILRSFGKPVLIKNVGRDGKPLEQWMYRYTAKLLGSEKVFLYFDGAKYLADWEYLKPDGKTSP